MGARTKSEKDKRWKKNYYKGNTIDPTSRVITWDNGALFVLPKSAYRNGSDGSTKTEKGSG